MTDRKIAIIGGGAAGYFAAARLRESAPRWTVVIFEAGPRPLAKVAITGGGRCNLTNSFEGIRSVAQAYPRGARLLERSFRTFGPADTLKWFKKAGVRCVTQPDHCVFPASQDAMQVVRTLLRAADGVQLRCNTKIEEITPSGTGWEIAGERFDAVLITTGGMQREGGFIRKLGLSVETPVPSLFTFRIDDPITHMAGSVVDASASLSGTKFRAEGPLLITDWGMSGPAILKLSSYAARYLAENGYRANLSVRWLPGTEDEVRSRLKALSESSPRRLASSAHPEEIPSRLWAYLCGKWGVPATARWSEVGQAGFNRIASGIMSDPYLIAGKSRFKEEFVTCGGVALSEINHATMQAKRLPGLFFAGEVLDIDAITGGFNLQAAWTTGFLAAEGILKTLEHE